MERNLLILAPFLFIGLVASCGGSQGTQDGNRDLATSGTVRGSTEGEAVTAVIVSPDSILAAMMTVEGSLDVGSGSTVDDWGVLATHRVALVGSGHAAVPVLTERLTSGKLSSLTIDGRVLSEGALAAALLWSMIYYEPTDSIGDLDGSWAGFVNIHSSAAELEAGQVALRPVVASRRYAMRP
jgi:hypothetical protein